MMTALKKSIPVLFLFLICGVNFAQNFSWITPNKTYLKLYAAEDGFYRISHGDFVQAGVNPSNIDPRTVKVLFKGNEIPIYFDGEQDGSFDPQDYLDFYGTRNYGGLTTTYQASFGPTIQDYITNEYFNLYSDTSAYWIGWDGPNGLRFTNSSYTVTNQYGNLYSLDRIHIERDSVYSLGLTTNPNGDFRYFNTEKISGEGWYWRNMFAPAGYNTIGGNFTVPLLSEVPANCTLRIFAFPNSRDSSFNEHKLRLRINSTDIVTLARDDYDRFDTTLNFSSTLLSASSTNTVTAIYEPTFQNLSATPSLYFDLFEIFYPKEFRFQLNECRISLTGSDTSSAFFKVIGYNSANPLTIYDVSNSVKITNISSDSDTLFFTGKQNGDFIITNKQITRKPFRISSRQVPDLVSGTNGADYVVIYNKAFESQAEQLRAHRQTHDNFRSVKADVESITDIFNYGIESPAAIRQFVNHVYSNWAQPRVGYITLMGRGSLDPKNNKLNSAYYRNFVPVYGNPPSDGYFTNFNFNGFTYFHQVAIGRMPVYTPQEAQDVVDKIVLYDSEQPQSWWKNFIMITGGPNRNEQIQYQTQSNQFVNQYLSPPPVSGVISKVYRNDSAGFITFNYKDSIRNEINRGGLIVNFIGHAASQDWELGLEDPATLSNGIRLPLVLSMTCYTGKNSEPNLRGFGEKFLYTPNRGALGFLGSTGWSFSGAGNQLNDYVFRGLALDTLRRLGDLLKFANNSMVPDSGNFQVRNMINCYDLLGDPASKLLLPEGPEFVIGQTDYRITDQYPLVGEEVTWTIFPKNYGLYVKDCVIRFEILKNGLPFRFKDTLITNFAFLDTASYTFSIDTIGNYSLKATLDYSDNYPNEDPANNVITIPLPLRNISYTPLKPIDNSVIVTDSVEFVGLNPQVDLRRNNVKVILQADTNRSFTNPLLNFSSASVNGVATRVVYKIPQPDTNIVYYWRTNAVINGDSAGWSETRRFLYNPGVNYMPGNRNNSNSRFAAGDSVVTIYSRYPGQYNANSINGLSYTGTGYKLLNSPGQLQVKSYGNNGSEASYFILPGYQFFIDGGSYPGLNLIKARKLTGKLVEFRNFAMTTPQSSDSVLAFLNTFDTTHYLMTAISSYANPSDSLHSDCKLKFKQFGSTMVDSVTTFGAFFTWAFIGALNSPPIPGAEEFNVPGPSCPNGYCPSLATVISTFLSTKGSLSYSIGPAHRWKFFEWNRLLPAGSSVSFDVSGVNTFGNTIPLYTELNTNNMTLIDTVNSYLFPELQLTANVKIDTLAGLESPEFRSLYFKYTPPAEIIPDNYSFVKSDSIVNEGAEVTISVKNYNIGFVPAGTIVYKWTANAYNGLAVLKTDTVYVPLQPDSSFTSSVTFNTNGLKDPETTIDTLDINFEVGMLNQQNDYYPFNNFAFTSVVIVGDSTGPSIVVTYDGEKILDGDIIKAKPDILFKFFDDSKLSYSIEDTTNIFIRQDGKRVYYNFAGQPNPAVTFNAVNEGNLKVTVSYKPDLGDGAHLFQYYGADKDGNKDTVVNNAYVSHDFAVRNLFNYPNPMTSDTYFTFDLFAADSPEKCSIKIFTVAGRLIKDINSPARVGFNRIYWDGKDNDGETMANGIYLYKLILEGGGKTETSIQKLAILR